MAITRNIVEMMGGTIKVQTEKNRGTEFIICLPLRVQTGTRREEKIAELAGSSAGGGRRFQHLRQRGKAADPCGNACGVDAFRPGGCAACTAVHRAGRPCRAYIIDWRLPDMNGIEVTRQIRSLNDDTPIIILTAYDWSDIEGEAKAAGVTASAPSRCSCPTCATPC